MLERKYEVVTKGIHYGLYISKDPEMPYVITKDHKWVATANNFGDAYREYNDIQR